MSSTDARTLEDFIESELVRMTIPRDSEAFPVILDLLEPARGCVEILLEDFHSRSDELSWRDTRGSIDLSEWLPDRLLDDILFVYNIHNEACELRHYIEQDQRRWLPAGDVEPLKRENPSLSDLKDHIDLLQGYVGPAKAMIEKLRIQSLSANYQAMALSKRIDFYDRARRKIQDRQERAEFERLKAKFEPDEVGSLPDMTWKCKVLNDKRNYYIDRELTVDQQIAHMRAGLLFEDDVKLLSARIQTEREEILRRAEDQNSTQKQEA